MLNRLLPDPGPLRVLTATTLVDTVGKGLWVTVSALYLTKVVGLTPAQYGIGLTVASAVCLVASTPMGYLADRRGPRGVLVVCWLLLAGLTAALLLVGSFPAFVALAAVTALADAGQRGARGAMIAGSLPPDRRVHGRAYLRATTNVGISLGAALAGVAIAVDTPAAYRLTIVGNAVSFVVVAAIALRLPELPAAPARPGPRLVALRDRPYLAFVALDGLLSMHHEILTVVLPLWIALRTDAPHWLVAVLLLVNTSMVVLLQVRASRGTEDLDGASRAARTAGVFVAGACVLFALSAGMPGHVAAALLVAGALVHVVGELRQAASGWGVSFGLAPEGAQGQYQATYTMGAQLGRMLAPAVLTWLALEHGLAGWLAMAVMFAALGAAIPAAVAWARRTTRAVPAAPGAEPAAV